MSKASAYFKVDNFKGNRDVSRLKSGLDALGGISSVSVSERTGSIAVDFDTSGADKESIRNKIEELGYAVLDERLENHKM